MVGDGCGGGFDGGVWIGWILQRGLQADATLVLVVISPAPGGVEDNGHGHAAFHFQLETIVHYAAAVDGSWRGRIDGFLGAWSSGCGGAAAFPHLRQHFGKTAWQVVGSDADISDGANGASE